MATESALVFGCSGEQLVGILHSPTCSSQAIGVVVVVGGPQYRVGSHRQFVQLARALAASGYPVLRFDYRGMGDSGGESRDFRAVGEDIRAAIDALLARESKLSGVVLMGLCDAVSAILMHGAGNPRVQGLILANPWVRTESGLAKAYVEQYYGRRFLQPTFWKKVFAGRFDFRDSAAGLLKFLKLRRRAEGGPADSGPEDFIALMRAGFASFNGPVLFLISGRDLTAKEFTDLCQSSSEWRALMARPAVEVAKFEDADHTFSAAASAAPVHETCRRWLATRVHTGRT